MKITKAQLKQIIKEELEVILTNEEAAEMFGEEIQTQLEEGGYAGHYIRDEESPDDIIASHPDPEGKNPDQVIYRWQQDEFDHREKVLKSIQALDYLKMRAREYHSDPSLNPGDIKALLQDDFMDSQYPKFFGIDEGEPSVADFIEQYAAGEELNEENKMKITKTQLKQIIKEEFSTLDERFEPEPYTVGNLRGLAAEGDHEAQVEISHRYGTEYDIYEAYTTDDGRVVITVTDREPEL